MVCVFIVKDNYDELLCDVKPLFFGQKEKLLIDFTDKSSKKKRYASLFLKIHTSN